MFLLMVFLVACAVPQAPEQKETAPAQEQKVVTQEEVVQPPQPAPTPSYETAVEDEVVTAPTSPKIDPYTQLGCEGLLTSAQFAEACGKNAYAYAVTYKVGTKNCFVNVKDKENERLTTGITLTGYKDGFTAMQEFERRLVVLKLGADKSVGERAYTFKKLDRETINFVRDKFIVEVGADTRLCSKEGVEQVAKVVDDAIK